VLSETRSGVLPLGPYLDTLRWVFIAGAPKAVRVHFWASLVDTALMPGAFLNRQWSIKSCYFKQM